MKKEVTNRRTKHDEGLGQQMVADEVCSVDLPARTQRSTGCQAPFDGNEEGHEQQAIEHQPIGRQKRPGTQQARRRWSSEQQRGKQQQEAERGPQRSSLLQRQPSGDEAREGDDARRHTKHAFGREVSSELCCEQRWEADAQDQENARKPE